MPSEHAVGVIVATRSRRAVADALVASTDTAWPGRLVERLVGHIGGMRRGRSALWPVAVAVLTAGALGFSRVHHVDAGIAASLVLAAVATAPLLLTRYLPLLGLSLVAGANAVFLVLARLAWPPTAVAAWLLALAASPLLLRRGPATTLLVSTEIAVLAAVFVPHSVNPTPWDASITEALAILLAWGGGESVRSRRESTIRKKEIAAQLVAMKEREAMVQGRADIARELHDVVAHHVSLIAVRAATAQYQVTGMPTTTQDLFGEIALDARAALDELRVILGVLRAAGEAPRKPQPSLADLPALIDHVRASGMSIRYQTAGAGCSLSQAAELCIYRVVQEGLTNAARYAIGEPVLLNVIFANAGITVEIDNPAPPAEQNGSTNGGFGLIGMRERVTSLGGSFRAGLTATGFQVSVSLPAESHRSQATS